MGTFECLRTHTRGGCVSRRNHATCSAFVSAVVFVLSLSFSAIPRAPLPRPVSVCADAQMLRVAEANKKYYNPILINVGLPRSGTTTLHMVFTMLNVSSRHIVGTMTKSNIQEFRNSFAGKMKTEFTNPSIQVREWGQTIARDSAVRGGAFEWFVCVIRLCGVGLQYPRRCTETAHATGLCRNFPCIFQTPT